MQEKLNEQNRSRQSLGTSSMGSTSIPPLPAGKVINKWAELDGARTIYKTPNKENTIQTSNGANNLFFKPGTRIFVLENQGSWSKVQTEDGVVGWFYKAGFTWMK